MHSSRDAVVALPIRSMTAPLLPAGAPSELPVRPQSAMRSLRLSMIARWITASGLRGAAESVASSDVETRDPAGLGERRGQSVQLSDVGDA